MLDGFPGCIRQKQALTHTKHCASTDGQSVPFTVRLQVLYGRFGVYTVAAASKTKCNLPEQTKWWQDFYQYNMLNIELHPGVDLFKRLHFSKYKQNAVCWLFTLTVLKPQTSQSSGRQMWCCEVTHVSKLLRAKCPFVLHIAFSFSN